MEIFTNTNFDFVSKHRIAGIVSTLMVATAIAVIAVKWFDFGVEFTGGTQITASFDHEVSIDELRDVLREKGLDADPTTLGGDEGQSMFLIRVGQDVTRDVLVEVGDRMRGALTEKYGESAIRFWSFDPELGDRAQVRIELPDGSSPPPEEIKALVTTALPDIKFEDVTVDRAGTINIQLQSLARDVVAELQSAFHAGNKSFSIEAIGPGVAADLQIKGLLSLVVACLLILGYIWFRFDLAFAPGAVVALVHDAMITAGIFSLFDLEFNVTTVAALLAIIGYSVNDTVVVYDRIRENIELRGDSNIRAVVNQSINETLSRTILTSVTTLISTVCIATLGGPVLRDFGIALTVGVVVGTYSSIFVAAALMLVLHRRRSAQTQKTKAAA